jgi:hypothetical protein
VLVLFKYNSAPAFAQYKTITVFIEGAAGSGRVIITFRQGLHGVETTYTGLCDSSFRTTGNNGVGLAQAQGIPGVRVESADTLDEAIAHSLAATGPTLVEVVVA